MKRMKLTPAGRVVVFLIIAAIIVGGVVAAYTMFGPSELIENFNSDNLKNFVEQKKQDSAKPADNDANKVVEKPEENKSIGTEINLSLDEWIG